MLYDYPGRMLVASIRSIFLMKTCLKAVANCSGNKKFRSQSFREAGESCRGGFTSLTTLSWDILADD